MPGAVVAGTSWIRRCAAVLAAGLLLAACGSDAGAGSGTISVGLIPFIGYAPLYVADELHVCERHGVRLKLVPGDDQAALDALVAAGRTDLGAYGNTSLTFANGAGIPLRAVLTIDYSVGADGIVARGASSVRELSARKIPLGTDRGDIAYFVLMATAAKEGLRPADFRHVQMANAQALPAFARGSVGAVGVAEPLLSQALKLPGAALVVSTRQDPGLVSDVFAATQRTLDGKAAELRGFADCWYDTLQRMRDDPGRSDEIISRRLGVRPEDVSGLRSSVEWPDRAAGDRYLSGGRLAATLTAASDLYRRLGLVRQDPPAAAAMISGLP